MGQPTSFSEQLFLLNYQLCKEFPALTPIAVNCEKYHTIIKLYKDLRILQIRENKNAERKTGSVRGKPQEQVIRRKAGNNWF